MLHHSGVNPRNHGASSVFGVLAILFGGFFLNWTAWEWFDQAGNGALPPETIAVLGLLAGLAIGGLGVGTFLMLRGRTELRLFKEMAEKTTLVFEALPQTDGWQPADDVTGHDGEPVSADADFFLPPPESIGEVRSAFSSLRKNRNPPSVVVRVCVVLVLATAGALGGWCAAPHVKVRPRFGAGQAPPRPVHPVEGALTFGFGGALLGVAVTNNRRSCTYVGTAGIARYRCKNGRSGGATGEVFLFSSAVALYTWKKIQRSRGLVDEGRQARFDWVDDRGQPCFQIVGEYGFDWSSGGSVGLWGLAAEQAWTDYCFAQSEEDVKAGGTMEFYPIGVEWVRVGQDSLIIRRRGQEVQLTAEDIGAVAVQKGVLVLRRAEGSVAWEPSAPPYRLGLLRMPNRLAFETALRDWTGLEWG
jgi:hypothetical protein